MSFIYGRNISSSISTPQYQAHERAKMKDKNCTMHLARFIKLADCMKINSSITDMITLSGSVVSQFEPLLVHSLSS